MMGTDADKDLVYIGDGAIAGAEGAGGLNNLENPQVCRSLNVHVKDLQKGGHSLSDWPGMLRDKWRRPAAQGKGNALAAKTA